MSIFFRHIPLTQTDREPYLDEEAIARYMRENGYKRKDDPLVRWWDEWIAKQQKDKPSL